MKHLRRLLYWPYRMMNKLTDSEALEEIIIPWFFVGAVALLILSVSMIIIISINEQ